MSEKFPAIPVPAGTIESQRRSLLALKEAVEMLTGQRAGSGSMRGVTAADLATASGSFVPRINTRKETVVVDGTIGADAFPILAGTMTPATGAADSFQVQARLLPETDATTGRNTNGAAVALRGPTFPSVPDTVQVYAGNNTAGYMTWTFKVNGDLDAPGSVLIPNNEGVVFGGTSVVVRDSSGHFFTLPRSDYRCYWNNSDGYWRWENGATFATMSMALSPGGSLNIGEVYYSASSAARLRAIDGNNIRFTFTNPGTSLFQVHTDTTPYNIPIVGNASDFAYVGGTGGPFGISLNGRDFAGNLFGIFVDAVSDARLKTNVRPVDVDARAVLRAAAPCAFDLKGDISAYLSTVGRGEAARREARRTAKAIPVRIGYIAQELRKHIPEAVNVLEQPPTPDSPLPMDMHTIVQQLVVPYLHQAMLDMEKEYEARFAAMAARIAKLEGTRA